MILRNIVKCSCRYHLSENQSRRSSKTEELKSTTEFLDDILSQPHISDADLYMLVEKVLVHQNEDKSLDVEFVFNGAFYPSVSCQVEAE